MPDIIKIADEADLIVNGYYEVIEKLSELRGLAMIHFAEKSVQNA